MSSKSEIREKIRAARNQNPGHDNYLHLLDIPEVKAAKVITSYYPMPGEPNLLSLNAALINAGKTLLLPRINNKKMEFVSVLANYESDLSVRSIFHEPVGNIFIGEINLALIPALAIDKSGNRLGQGGGYYDQFLVKTSAFRIGVIHEREFLKKTLPTDWYDQRVEAVATETNFFRIVD